MRIEGNADAFTMPIIQSGGRAETAGVGAGNSSAEWVARESEKAAKVQELRKEMTAEEVVKQVENANHQLKIYDRRLEFSIHDETHKIMVKVINTNDDSVIREIPSERALDMLAYVWKLTGILLDEKR